ncbi:hypothetical protein [Thalassoglobus polymorphus]|uniref:Uncharacterized protein n=1 Tax=Thalassoglobus polymorphus TaxID=2527994 RepID=A0A517QKM9_9PLAN|nr:hypothetical protein [Thalassoglobus polymorphus]QDT32077.1 hypothetical protein Mal48_13180 [Thalassoglobus polymorphus]
MRIQPWMITVTSILVLVAVQAETSGQQPGSYPGSVPPGAPMVPMQGQYGPGPHQSPYATNHPQQIYPPGTPGEYQPWPQISPFNAPNVAMDQHYNKDGVWFRDIVYRKRKYFGSVELMSIAFRNPGNSTIGSPYATRADFDTMFPLGVPIDFANMEAPDPNIFGTPTPGWMTVDDRIFPIPSVDGGNAQFDQVLGYLYPIRNTNQMSNLGRTLGTQIRWGFENEDGTGLQLTGWWAFDDSAHFKSGSDEINGVPVTQAMSLAAGGQNLLIRGVIPYYTGEPIAQLASTFGPGRTAKYDILYEMEQTTRAAGTSISLYTQPIYKSTGVKIRPLWGARYTYLDENFRFRGIDSGLTYDIDEETYRPDGAISPAHALYEARLNSEVRSHVAGPEVGLRFDLGDSDAAFKVWAETIFGLNANQENISIWGDNIGDPLHEARFENIGNPRMLDPTVQSEFSDKKSSTHVSPSFQQSIFAEVAAFRNLPIIRNASVFEDTSFRFGYTFFWLGEVARPAESIKWQGFPLFPEVQSNRTSWWMHQLNFAVDWTF